MKKKILIIAVILIAVGLIAWRLFGSQSSKVNYQTAEVSQGTVVSSVTASGTVLSANYSEVNAKASGVVSELLVKDGDYVYQGQEIAKITLDQEGAKENASALATYESAVSNLASAKATEFSLQSDMFSAWDKFKTLAESSNYDTADERSLPAFHIAEKTWLASEAKYKNQQTVIAAAQSSLASAYLAYQQTSPIILAPAAGTIDSITVAPGIIINSSQTGSDTTTQSKTVAVIKTGGQPIISVNVSEVDVLKIKSGQKATVTLDSFPDKTFTGKVVSIDKIGTVTSGVTNYPVIIQLDIGSGQILPNMAATVAITIAAKNNVLNIPSAALQTQNGQTSVRVLKNGQPESIEVEVGLKSDTSTEITNGNLKVGDQVITGTETSSQTNTTGRSVFGGTGFNAGFGGGGGAVRINR